MSGYLYLAIAIAAEVMATSALKASAGFTRLWPSLAVVIGYGVSFYALAIVLKTIPMGVAYSIWSGLGIVLITIVGAVWFKQIPNLATAVGMSLIIAGVVVVNLFCRTSIH